MVVLRLARVGDVVGVARVHVRAWQVGYRGLLPEEYLAGLRAEDWGRRYTFEVNGGEGSETVLAERDGRIVGFATIGPARDDDRATSGELYALYVDPNVWSAGIGRALMSDARRRLTEAGFSTATRWVLDGNDRAQRFYRTDGWRADGSERAEQVHGILVDEVRYQRQL